MRHISGSRKHLIKISKNQITALCISKFIKDHTMPKDVFKHCKALPFEKLRNASLYKSMWKISHEIDPHSISNLLDENGILHSVREQRKFILPYKNTEVAKNYFCYQGVKLWNKLPSTTLKEKLSYIFLSKK